MVRLVWNHPVEHYEAGLERLYTPVEESHDGGKTWKQIARVMYGVEFAPFRVKKLRDGSLIAMGSVWPAMGPGTNRRRSGTRFAGEVTDSRTFFLYSPDGGYSWTGPHTALHGISAGEADFVELPDGRLLFINSSVQGGAQARQFVHRVDTGFLPDPVNMIQGAGADAHNPQAGIVPESIDITPDGLIVGARRGGKYACSNDLGDTWHVLSDAAQGTYQPQLVCLPDGRFMSAGHRGTDAALGQRDMSIGVHSFRLQANLPAATRLTLERALAADDSQFINTYLARLTVGGNPVAGKTVEFRYKHVWSPNGTFNTTPLSQVSDVRTAVTDHNGVATFALTELESIRDIHDAHRVQANFVPQAGENLATCLSPAFEAYTLTTKRRTPHSYPLYFAENSLFISAPTAEQFPELVDLLNRFKSSGNFTSCAEDATMDNWADAMGGRKRAQEIVDFLVANHMLTETADGKYRWYRSVHCGGHVIEHVRVDDVPDYTN